jgi:hypothetical protein
MNATMDAVAKARALFFSPKCQCGARKRVDSNRKVLCAECLKQLPSWLQTAVEETELAEAILGFYDQAIRKLKTRGKR